MVIEFDFIFIKNYQKYTIPLDLTNNFAILSNLKCYIWRVIEISFKNQKSMSVI